VLSLTLSVLLGSGIGTALGYFGQCSSGTCPLTSTWWRGALYGAGMGLLFGLTSMRGRSATASDHRPNVPQTTEKSSDADAR
jgi:hypothetical protein